VIDQLQDTLFIQVVYLLAFSLVFETFRVRFQLLSLVVILESYINVLV
jgi:hypothetical protein